jgi:transposase
MAQPIAPDYGQQFLFPPALEDWVPKDHPVRFIREFVDQLDLAALGFSMPISNEGRPPYAPGLLLKIWLYGYHHQLRSTRKLEAGCRQDLALLWLTGLNAPDHNSLWRFWRDNKKALRRLFKRSVELAVKAGLVGLVLQAVDGTKIQAAAAAQGGWRKETMQKLFAVLDSQLNEVEKQLEAEGPAPEGSAYRLPEELQERKALRETIKTGLNQLEQDGRKHYHPQEPEARRMKCQGKYPFAYNGQVVVDQSHGVVVAAEVSVQEDDSHQLVPMIEQAQDNTGSQNPLTLADANYGSGAQIAQAARKNMKILVRPCEGGRGKDHPYHARHFPYDAVAGTVSCPQKQLLDFGGQSVQKGQLIKTYRCHVKDCPAAALCKDAKGRRVIEIWEHTGAVQAMRQRLEQVSAQRELKRRGQIIERHFGQIKQHEGFRRWTFKGWENVRTQWALLNLISNLRVLHRHWRAQKGGPRCPTDRGGRALRAHYLCRRPFQSVSCRPRPFVGNALRARKF